MSGIAGIIHFDGAPVQPGLVEGMTTAMAHRGPDGRAHWVRGNVALGQCMLRTTPESLEEHQPLATDDESLVLVMDGRVDNWEDLRRELLGRGARLRDHSDAELVLRSYETWGSDCLAHIEGDFALVIWDARRQTAFCARDRMGAKPFNYRWDGRSFAFSSELHAILQLPWVTQEPNEGLLVEFLADEWSSHDETFWKGVLRLPQAHQMEVLARGSRLERYWQPDFDQALPYRRDEEYIEHYRSLVLEVVRRMSRSCRPLGCEVSGGLDSSAVFCVAHHLQRSRRLLAPRLEGYTLAFAGDRDADELEYSRAVGEHLGVPIIEVPPTLRSAAWYREWAGFYREFPGFPNGVMSWDLRQRARDDGCRVLLGGIGGDEWVGGTRLYYAEELASRRWRPLARCFLADVREMGLPSSLWWLARYGLAPLLPASLLDILRQARRRVRRQDRAWLSTAFRQEAAARCRTRQPSPVLPARATGRRRLQQLLQFAFRPLARELEGRMLAKLGLEIRQPLDDPGLVQFAVATPERLRLRGQTNKHIHLQAMAEFLPAAVRQRKTKAEFSLVGRTLLGGLERELTHDILERRRAWVEPAQIRRMYREFCSGQEATDGDSDAGWVLLGLFGGDVLWEETVPRVGLTTARCGATGGHNERQPLNHDVQG